LDAVALYDILCAEIDRLCDSVIRRPLEELDLSIFDDLEPGDFLFIDSSHRTFSNSDVTVVFMDVLPRLRTGVIVHFHDIFWPYDYLPEWANQYYSEQYLLHSYLLGADISKSEDSSSECIYCSRSGAGADLRTSC
jgi:hypothetical protein